MKKLFCFDIDGTLRTTTDHQIPESTIKALNLLRKKGHILLVSTGMNVYSLKNSHIYYTFVFDAFVFKVVSEVRQIISNSPKIED